MMNKVGRNDPCPCGSGKKYKKCCYLIKEQPSTAKQITFKNTFEEDYVISELLRSSKEFNAFYKAERAKIEGPLIWTTDGPIPEGVENACTTLSTGEKVIGLRQVPVKIENAMSIAHELQHFIIENSGFPHTTASNQGERLCPALNSMVHDPLVNAVLETYGFDLQTDHKNKTDENLCYFRTHPSPPSNRLGRILWMFNYVKDILLWELVCDEGDNDKSEFQLWFDVHYPDIANVGQELLVLVKDIGYDTPERMHTLLKEVIQRYRLSGILSLTVK